MNKIIGGKNNVRNSFIKNHFIDGYISTRDYRNLNAWYRSMGDMLQRNQVKKVYSAPQVVVQGARVHSIREIKGIVSVVPSDIIIIADHKELLKSDTTSSANLL